MLEGKSWSDYTNLLSPKDSKKVRMKKVYWIKCDRYRKFKKPKMSNIFDKTFLFFVEQ